jgi:hypothetical protein
MYGTAPPRGTPIEGEGEVGDISDSGPLRVDDDR